MTFLTDPLVVAESRSVFSVSIGRDAFLTTENPLVPCRKIVSLSQIHRAVADSCVEWVTVSYERFRSVLLQSAHIPAVCKKILVIPGDVVIVDVLKVIGTKVQEPKSWFIPLKPNEGRRILHDCHLEIGAYHEFVFSSVLSFLPLFMAQEFPLSNNYTSLETLKNSDVEKCPLILLQRSGESVFSPFAAKQVDQVFFKAHPAELESKTGTEKAFAFDSKIVRSLK